MTKSQTIEKIAAALLVENGDEILQSISEDDYRQLTEEDWTLFDIYDLKYFASVAPKSMLKTLENAQELVLMRFVEAHPDGDTDKM